MRHRELLTIDDLREQYPEWEFRVTYVEVSSGPGSTRYSARRAGALVGALSLADLAEMIRGEEQRRGW